MYELRFIVTSNEDFEDLVSRFYERFDGMLAERCGEFVAAVCAEGASAWEAAHRAIHQLRTALGVTVDRVDADLVDIPEIAARLDKTRQTVHLWATGERRPSTFPRPVAVVGGKRIWRWAEVAAWANQILEADELEGLLAEEAALVDAELALAKRARTSRAHLHSIVAGWSPMATQSSTAPATTMRGVPSRPSHPSGHVYHAPDRTRPELANF